MDLKKKSMKRYKNITERKEKGVTYTRGLDSKWTISNAKDLTNCFDRALAADSRMSSHNDSIIRQSAPDLGFGFAILVQ